MTKELIAQGAEAKIFLESERVIKLRVEKRYRHPVLDEKIRKQRTKKEARILFKARGFGLNVPEILNLNKKQEPDKKYELEIEFIKGDKLSEKLNNYNEKKQFDVMKKLGEQVGLMHKNNIIHSDLTTSNIILRRVEVFIIDFGLAYFSHRLEDKAVDIHLLKQALEAKHFVNNEELFNAFLRGYNFSDSNKVLERLKVVEKRGRYKH